MPHLSLHILLVAFLKQQEREESRKRGNKEEKNNNKKIHKQINKGSKEGKRKKETHKQTNKTKQNKGKKKIKIHPPQKKMGKRKKKTHQLAHPKGETNEGKKKKENRTRKQQQQNNKKERPPPPPPPKNKKDKKRRKDREMKRSIPLPPSPTTSHSSGGDNHSRWWHQSQTAALLSPPCPYAHTSLPWPPSPQSLHSSGVTFSWKWRIKRILLDFFLKGRFFFLSNTCTCKSVALPFSLFSCKNNCCFGLFLDCRTAFTSLSLCTRFSPLASFSAISAFFRCNLLWKWRIKRYFYFLKGKKTYLHNTCTGKSVALPFSLFSCKIIAALFWSFLGLSSHHT